MNSQGNWQGNNTEYMQAEKYDKVNKIQFLYVSLREELQHSCIECFMNKATIVDFFINRSLQCAEMCGYFGWSLVINKGGAHESKECEQQENSYVRDTEIAK